jgi:hypothetical protein
MKVTQAQFMDGNWSPSITSLSQNPQWILAFGSRELLPEALKNIRDQFPGAILTAASTSGEIFEDQVYENSVSLNLVSFEKTELKSALATCSNVNQSEEAGKQLGRELNAPDLKHIFVLSNGLTVNGTALAKGIQQEVGAAVSISGGLAGDGADFKKTIIFNNDQSGDSLIVAVGLYGDALSVSCSAYGGWSPFGPIRLVTNSDGSVLNQLDNSSALVKYKEYLGDDAAGLPMNALLYPLQITPESSPRSMVRTVLAIDEKTNAMTFAGDIPKGSKAQLMRANTDELVDGAKTAADNALADLSSQPQLAILVSCVGRKLLMKQRTEEEVEVVRDVLGEQSSITGFYSYGELAPIQKGEPCDLHNQTMTITLISEK